MVQSSTSNGKEAEATSGAAPVISLPKGGGAIRGIGEKFGTNPVTGTGAMTIPIATSPGRSGFGPQLALSYDSGAGNGPFGLGWSLGLPSIVRKTDKGLPRYEDAVESDVFILSGSEDLVPVTASTAATAAPAPGYSVQRYRPRIEGLFARIERWTADGTGEIHWRTISRDNITTLYGADNNSRIFDPADPAPVHPTRIFSWLISQRYDDKGNAIRYEYVSENGIGVDGAQANEHNRTAESRGANRYLKRIKYGNAISRLLPDFASTAWLFEVVFDYGDGHLQLEPLDPDDRQIVSAHAAPSTGWPVRLDPFSTYRAGFELRTYRLCERVLMFHHFPDELGVDDYLVRSTDFDYERGAVASFITTVTQSGYVAWPDAATPSDRFLRRTLPPVELHYSKALLSSDVRELDADSAANLPVGLDGSRFQWVDLDGEGLSGILSEQGSGWFYKRNLGDGRFGPIERVGAIPAAALVGGERQLLDLSGTGQLDLAEFGGATPGFYERTVDDGWTSLTPFPSLPRIDWGDPNLRFVDLTGDGHADVLITEESAFRWHPSLAADGFGAEARSAQPWDEEVGPRLVFADGTQSIYLADLSGDGLADLVRIRNAEVRYWPNLGYGRFGGCVTMDNAPVLDDPDLFDQRRIRLADIDGSGLTDIVYLERGRVSIYRNLAGNSWGDRETLSSFPVVNDLSTVVVVDLLGTGTACLVWSSPLPGDAQRPLRYIELMAEGKPHLLIGTKNNLGAETRVAYAPSTQFYVADREAGTPWITKLPFPVHVVERVETWDWISRNRFVSRYAYHHGYFDGVEREFRGFGMVEQWDTEEITSLGAGPYVLGAANAQPASHVAPVLTKSWFHTGVYVGRDRVSNYFAGLRDATDRGEYYREPAWRDDDAEARTHILDDTILPDGLTVDEEREACRSLKGMMLRQEVYALDGTARAADPYTVTEQNFDVRCLERRDHDRGAVFFTHAHEALTYHYERNPADPRVTHALTLEVNDYGDVLRSLAIGYGRRASPLAEQRDRDAQAATKITYAENVVTNAIDDVQHPDDYRAPVAAETRTYELTGFFPENGAERFTFDAWTRNGFAVLDAATTIPYEDVASGTASQKRLIERSRTRYRRNDLTALSPLGTAESRAIPGESYKLAFTASLAASIFVDKGTATALELDTLLAGDAAYVHGDGDADWWIPSGRTFFSAAATQTAAQELAAAAEHFFLPRRYRDAFGHESTVAYDGPTDPAARRYDLLVAATSDALGNTVAAAHDYRVLQPRLITDANGNRSAAAFDALGMTVATAVMGKPAPAPVEGDSLVGIVPDPTRAMIDAVHDSVDPHGPAAGLLQGATSRIIYDFDRYQRTQRANPGDATQWLPAYVASVARETHLNDPLPAYGLRVQLGFSFSDGFGREIQHKIQAEPEIVAGTVAQPRWVGSGWTIFNNKGKPVRRYEPFFSASHRFEFGVQVGVSTVMFYDPVERVVATLRPDHLYAKVVFDPWQQTTYDASDTVAARNAQTGDPRSDPDIAGYVAAYFAGVALDTTAPWTTWYEQRSAGTLGADEQAAALKAAAHADTPTTAHLDTLGRPFLTVARNRVVAPNHPLDGTEEALASRVELDIEGNERAVYDAAGRCVMRYAYDMLGNRVHQASMDAGARWKLTDVAAKPVRSWDARGHRFSTVYDALQRPLELHVRGTTADSDPRTLNIDALVDRTEYGESHVDAERLNLRGRVHRRFDAAGVVTNVALNPTTNELEAYDFKGNPLRSTRQLVSDYRIVPDWGSPPALDAELFTSSVRYDALNRAVQTLAPHSSLGRATRNVIQPSFNEANLLERVDVWLDNAAEPGGTLDPAIDTPSAVGIRNIDYDAKGQRQRIDYRNGASTTYEYDPLTFRLTRLQTRRDSAAFAGDTPQVPPSGWPGQCLQNLRYTYDPAGNIIHIQDDAQQTIYFKNRRVEPSNDYTYDALYRLIDATGREHLGQLGAAIVHSPDDAGRVGLLSGDASGHYSPRDGTAMATYAERYVYDVAGNFIAMQHRGGSGAQSWTRAFAYAEQSVIEDGAGGAPARMNNRLTSTGVSASGAIPYVEPYEYDAHGNMVRMPHLGGGLPGANMQWDYRDQLRATALGGGGDAYYVYDASGQRVRKVWRKSPGLIEERIYLGGFELFRRHTVPGASDINAGTATFERETLHVMDGKQRLALVETRTLDSTGTDHADAQLIRYQLGNHLGSATLELDDDGGIISYEEYTPYGSSSYQAVRSQTETGKRYRYTGMERDEESGLNYHHARYLAVWLARWIRCDPDGLEDGLNLFQYARDNPIRLTDPSGTQSTSETLERLNKIRGHGAKLAPLDPQAPRGNSLVASTEAALGTTEIQQLKTFGQVVHGTAVASLAVAGAVVAAEMGAANLLTRGAAKVSAAYDEAAIRLGVAFPRLTALVTGYLAAEAGVNLHPSPTDPVARNAALLERLATGAPVVFADQAIAKVGRSGGAAANVIEYTARGEAIVDMMHWIKDAKGVPNLVEFETELLKHQDSINDIIAREGMASLKARIAHYMTDEGRIVINAASKTAKSALEPAGPGRALSHYPDVALGGDAYAIGGTVDSRINSIIGANAKAVREFVLGLPDDTKKIYLRFVLTK